MKTCPQCHATYPNDIIACPADRTSLVDFENRPEGAVIKGKYRILAKLGQDIAATVYKALELKPEEICTLKLMNRDLAGDPDFVIIFEQEARQRKKVRHTNVARVEGVDKSCDGRPFIVMEYVEGRSLREIIQKEAPLTPLRTCAIAKQVAAGLGAAHALGVVHRDVKPGNIFLIGGADSERVKLLGFGVSSLKEARLGARFRTSPEAVIGTFQYLSPEQALGKLGDELDGRADLYSLGVVMYQMLTGELPFQATTPAQWMMAHIQANPDPIRVAHADLAIPDVLTNLVLRCLAKSPVARPASARHLMRELEQVEKELEQTETATQAASQTPGHRPFPGWKFWKR